MNMYFRKMLTITTAAALCHSAAGCSSAQKADEGRQETLEDVQQEAGQDGESGENTPQALELGEFVMEDIEGKEYTREMFADNELTMVNIFTTWCTPCINEIPDLEKLHVQMKEQGVGVIGIVLDAVKEDGSRDEEAVEKAGLLAERTGASYPFLIPDEGMLNGRLMGIEAVPETFFVNKDGNITGSTYSGSRSLEAWTEVVETELSRLQGEES